MRHFSILRISDLWFLRTRKFWFFADDTLLVFADETLLIFTDETVLVFADETVFDFVDETEKFQSSPNAIPPPFGIRVQQLLLELEIDLDTNSIQEDKFGEIPPWTVKRPESLLDLAALDKDKTPPEAAASVMFKPDSAELVDKKGAKFDIPQSSPAVFHPTYVEKFQSSPNAIPPPFGIRVQQLLLELEIDLDTNSIQEDKFGEIPPWTVKRPESLLDLAALDKDKTPPEHLNHTKRRLKPQNLLSGKKQ
ncbi:hypothetical protein EGW08_018409 [Elysia chlorotica]|uniref:Uncharacterized protein n=1 Tax=Elysia chlorotica TaxID=188477 RepID=A0A433SWY5_ELYCH|nr:hypothetical protein EGW08_018409 [Elysia chlorotica]